MSGKFAWGAEVGAWGETAKEEARICSRNFAWGEGTHAWGENLMS
ncbi:hypothetical protein A2U01_0074932 [Trifolium medium]|uniref:Uncharacterized protein n=1 Tax=Trifolium medium TaxID=97028 RepID=A0A392T032_9FABA|nr:hypothetical protein [Trifolium medium]